MEKEKNTILKRAMGFWNLWLRWQKTVIKWSLLWPFLLPRFLGRLLREEQVLDSWSILLADAQGKAEDIFSNTENLIRETKVPDISMERKAFSPGAIRALLGVEREVLVVKSNMNNDLKTYHMYINARDYGNNLHVSWYMFDQQDLNAYVTNAHHCLVQAVENLMIDLGQDPSKMERRSRGILGIS